jgi:hypothetical protein
MSITTTWRSVVEERASISYDNERPFVLQLQQTVPLLFVACLIWIYRSRNIHSFGATVVWEMQNQRQPVIAKIRVAVSQQQTSRIIYTPGLERPLRERRAYLMYPKTGLLFCNSIAMNSSFITRFSAFEIQNSVVLRAILEFISLHLEVSK